MTCYKQNEYKGHNGKVSKHSEQFAKATPMTNAYITATLPLGSCLGTYTTVTILSSGRQSLQSDWSETRRRGCGARDPYPQGGSVNWLHPFLQRSAIIY